MKLTETIEMMCSDDYQERFKGEYFQLCIRIDGLSKMLEKYKKGQLPFTPKCCYHLLDAQLKSMHLYKEFLEVRAKEENIKL